MAENRDAEMQEQLKRLTEIVGDHARQFDAIEKRFDAVDKHFDAVDERFDAGRHAA